MNHEQLSTQLEKLPKVHYIGKPRWPIDVIQDYLGITADWMDIAQLKNIGSIDTIDNLIVHEDSFYDDRRYRKKTNKEDSLEDFVDNYKIIKDLILKKKIKSLMIYNHHPWQLDNNKIQELDEVAKDNNISILVCGHYDFKLQNIKVQNVRIQEKKLNNPVVRTLSMILIKNKKKLAKEFILNCVPKDEFRIKVLKYLDESGAVPGCFEYNKEKKSSELYKKQDDFLKILKKYKLDQYAHALQGFGSGLPNLEQYERALLEIVIESNNLTSWQLSEKTFRPIAFGIPIVFLGHKKMFDLLTGTGYGYRLYDNNFYEKWHSNTPLDERLLHLKEFLTHIKNEADVENIKKIADHNYDLFWNRGYTTNYEEINSFLIKFFLGEKNTVIKNIYNSLNA